ncbi:MAG TPA: site-2 protease family protein [Nitrospira sp.]|nr:site-2 protease family protein [Nitrospira sp.]
MDRDRRSADAPIDEDMDRSFVSEPAEEDAGDYVESTFSRYVLPIGLFALTIFTTLWAGAYQDHPNLFRPMRGAWDLLVERPEELMQGIPFAATLLLILGTHELAHFLCSKWHRVPASLPLFIPGLPVLVGTFGAIIRVRGQIVERKALFDIGISGPLAGFVVALTALVVGLHWSQVEIGISPTSPFLVGRSLLIDWGVSWAFGDLPRGASVNLHPVAEAAWFGLFVTCLNLIPIGQLDGGHVAYALWGKTQRTVALGVIPILLVLGYFGWQGWWLWALLSSLLGVAHPPIPSPRSPLGAVRIGLGWATVVLFVLIFPPFPIVTR